MDPKNPGAVDEIIHLGDYWNESGIRENKEEVLKLNREVGRLFRRAYEYLAAASLFNEAFESYFVDLAALDFDGLNSLALDLVNELFGHAGGGRGSERHLFSSAITPQGPCNYLKTIFDDCEKRYILTGGPGTGKSTLVTKLYRAAIERGVAVEAYHCALNPEKMDHLLLPGLGIGIISSCEPHLYEPKKGDIIIGMTRYVDHEAFSLYLEDMERAYDDYHLALEKGVEFISRAKQVHDQMETYYIPHMDFTAIDRRREEILDEILSLPVS